MELVKFHGMGNDYLVLSEPGWEALEDAPDGDVWRALVAEICDRHTGLGGDGILLPVPGDGADYGLRIFNPDGSTAEKSGNGLRIFARWLVDSRGAPNSFSVSLPRDVVHCTVAPEIIEIQMGAAVVDRLNLSDLTLEGDIGSVARAYRIDLGNPHCSVFLTSTDWEEVPWKAWGAALEVHPLFPEGTNVQFVKVIAPDRLEMRIWERGAGWTLASGSSCCAAAASAVLWGRCVPGWITVEMEGGELSVHAPIKGFLTLRGPVEKVGTFRLSGSWLDSRAGRGASND